MFDDLPITPIRTVKLPQGDIVYVTRALVQNSWLTYTDALPPDEGSWMDLQDYHLLNIKRLAEALSKLHRQVKGYKLCDESPFTVSRWWDPEADDGYESGRICLMRFEGLSAHQLFQLLPRKSALQLRKASSRSDHWVEAIVPSTEISPRQCQLFMKPPEEAGLGLLAEATSGARL